MRKAKRVKFRDAGSDDDLPNCGPSSTPAGVDAPKTSEYAFFRKLKRDAIRSYYPSRPQVDNQLNARSRIHKSLDLASSSNVSDISRQREPSTRFSFLAEEARKHYSFLSPPKGESKKLATSSRDTSDKVKQGSFCCSENVPPVGKNAFFSPVAAESVQSGNHYFGKNIFAEKRRKLHQLAADTLSLDVEKCHSKGFDFVSRLLSRLYPKGNEDDDSRFAKRKTDSSYQLPALPMSDEPEKRPVLHRKRSRKMSKEPPWSNVSGSTKKILISEAVHPLKISNSEASFLDELANYYSVSDPMEVRHCRQSDSSFCLPYKENWHSTSFLLEELNEEYDPSESASREAQNLLLNWNFDSHEEKPVFKPALDIEKHTYSTFRTSRCVQNQRILHIPPDEIALPSALLSVFSQNSPEYSLLPYFNPTRFHCQDMKRVPEYDDSLDLVPVQLSPKFSLTPKYLTQAKTFDTDYVLGNTILPDQDQALCISNVFSIKQPGASESALLSRGLDLNLGWKCFSSTDLQRLSGCGASHLTEEENECGLLSSNSVESYALLFDGAAGQREFSFTDTFSGAIGRPLLLENSSWDGAASQRDSSFTDTFAGAIGRPLILDNSSWDGSYFHDDDHNWNCV